MFGLQGPRLRVLGGSLQVSRVALVATLVMGLGLLVPHEDPVSRGERMDELRAEAASELRQSQTRGAETAAGSLDLSFDGPELGTDRADAWERATGAAKGTYATEARLQGEGRLAGSLWLYPSVCSPCTLSSTTQPELEEWGLVGIQYSLTPRDGEAFLRLSGDLDWEVSFDHGLVATEDPIGPPIAALHLPLRHDARWVTPEGGLVASESEAIHLEVRYEAVQLGDVAAFGIQSAEAVTSAHADAPGAAANPRPAPYVLEMSERDDGTLRIERVPVEAVLGLPL